MKSLLAIEPRYQETDQMGIIHHSVYPIWYEIGRVKFCDDLGFPYKKIEELGIGLAMIHMDVNYLKPAYFGSKLTMETKLIKFTRVRMVFRYEIFNLDHEMIHYGESHLVWVNQDLKPINLYKVNPHLYELFLKQVEA
ncbi:MAG: acyl-CoA thioesterase [Acholeplasmataceae bacterium]|nr:acyl-CoA thioesterase [Acholeplasmataceae bacterium]